MTNTAIVNDQSGVPIFMKLLWYLYNFLKKNNNYGEYPLGYAQHTFNIILYLGTKFNFCL